MQRSLQVIFLLILAMALGLTACSKGDSSASGSDGKVNLTMTIWGSENEKKIYQERLDIVKQTYPDINVKLNLVAGDYDQKVQTMIAGGTAPDIMMIAENYQAYASKKQIIALDDMIQTNNVNMSERYSQDIVNLMKYDGKQYGMPDRAGAMVLFYNKDLFDKAGVKYPSKDWTQQDLMNAAQKLTVKENGKTIQWGYYPGSWWPQWMQLIYQNGGSLFDQKGKSTFNTEPVRNALQFMNDLTFKYGTGPTPTEIADMGNIGADPLFAQGKIAMETTGFWNIGSLAKVEGINWDIASIWGETNAFFNGFTITNASEHKEEAFKVIEALTTLDGQMPLIKAGQDAPATKAGLSSDEFLNAEYGGKIINMAAFSESKIYAEPFNPKWNEMMKLINDKLSVYFNNKASLEDTVTQVQSGLEKLYP
ncbi:sugar ABC transporter substrate-binding protein [Paenibacillus peoriae]|uniref:ABC transporter substrate-binding protein n=1 Tax=Paenibacillus peoriae TaxID=59893 RepID=UPI00026C6135|nr:sugar ABC transporter substrate-binding protein [Paenibacillus peoriae]MEC0184581.1 sugar ABC transporter substrate-binding protein [Paenibacillus peoriae]